MSDAAIFGLPYSAHFLPGRGRRSGHCKIGVVHAVQPIISNGDNFNTALCGKTPTGISLGWSKTSFEITCKKCRSKLGNRIDE